MSENDQTHSNLVLLVGKWIVESPQYPEARGEVTFEWIEGKAFIVQHYNPKPGIFPASMMVIGWDDTLKNYSVLYHDSRGVSRIYQMSLNDLDWKIWRDAPGFAQRFSGKIGEDGETIRARWEKSLDNTHWELDFDLVYTKTG